MVNPTKLMSVGISLLVLAIIITQVMVPNTPEIAGDGYKTINAIVKLFPLFLSIGGLLAITSLFTGKK